ncbi:terminase small subunit [Rhizobium sp. NLR22b]|uniref:terminase small subunit n=1 Tax=Rhizobium sp. NLR22b TaxID=2731115 RepID=UPI001C8340AE|nr:terminase small subunit [Rhizobium sp. NLR22b]MBX5238638.1 terminase small subunit [Rhizobium sp. NLR22b]
MPVLKNARHETFAQSVAKGNSATEAYEAAGFKPHRQNAARLMTNDDVCARIKELQAKAVKKVEITVDSLAAELEEARAIAITEKQSSAAVSATMGKAKLFGLGVEHRKLSGTVQIVTITAKQLDALTDDELALLETAYPVLQKLGIVDGDQGAEAEA